MTVSDLFDLTKSLAKPILEECTYVEEVLEKLRGFIVKRGETLDTKRYVQVKDGVWIAKSASVADSAFITAPCIIGEETEIRQCAFIRGSVIIGDRCVVGNSSEVKNSILFDRVQVPHFNYVGDSVLGYAAHLGAGAVTSNVKSDKSEIYVTYDGKCRNSHRTKLGAMIGDFAEIGCGAVLCPGTVIGRGSTVYPLALVRGTIPAHSIFKDSDNIVRKY